MDRRFTFTIGSLMLWVTLLLTLLGAAVILNRQGNRIAFVPLSAFVVVLLAPLTYFRLNDWPRMNGGMRLFVVVVILCLLWAIL